MEQIVGELITFENATLIDPYGHIYATNANGYMRAIATVVLDQGGNIMGPEANLTAIEQIKPVNPDAIMLQ